MKLETFRVLGSKFVKFLMPILKWQVHSSPKFCIPLQFHERFFVCTFLAQTIYTLLKRSPLKWKFLRLFECFCQNLSNSLCQFLNGKSILLQILYHSSVLWKITPLYFFSPNNIYFAQKKPIKAKIFETSKCSDQNLSNFLCKFRNNKLIPLQVLYPSSVSWKIILLYFFSSNSIYFAQKEPIKMKIFETFKRSSHNLSNSLCQFWNNKSINLQILYPSSISWKITPLYFF